MSGQKLVADNFGLFQGTRNSIEIHVRRNVTSVYWVMKQQWYPVLIYFFTTKPLTRSSRLMFIYLIKLTTEPTGRQMFDFKIKMMYFKGNELRSKPNRITKWMMYVCHAVNPY
jgi:hypothetical protein